MDSLLVITIVAQDRPGLVESIAAAVARHGGNWLESRMSRLGGQFAGILRAEVPAEQVENLRNEFRQLEKAGLHITVRADESAPATPAGRIAELALLGQDRPGIIRQISEAFARSQVNVEELETECTSAPMSGETLFNARARVQIPPSCDMAELRAELEKIATDLMVDVSLREV